MTQPPDPQFGPWAPGLSSTIPAHLMPRVTLFDPANGSVTWAEAKSLSDTISLKPQDLAVFRPDRLALHHVLIRVTAQLHVPDGPNYADFGLSLREMARVIFEGHVTPELPRIKAAFDALRDKADDFIAAELDRWLAEPPAPEKTGLLKSLFGRGAQPAPVTTREDRAFAALEFWSKGQKPDDALTQSCTKALARCVGAILSKRGAMLVAPDMITRIATNLVLNDQGDAEVGQLVADIFDKAVEQEGYYRLPAQTEPVVLNAKGASASGKSTIRLQQRQIAETLGIDWQDFAVISPDYWRKQLLDYDSLGDDFKYAAMLTGQELELIDRKLDRLMAANAVAGHVPHMLIDRFRFDSFQPMSERPADSNLLTRIGAKIYMFFMVTPPSETVERAWLRGISTGRYKAVDDLLYHNIEAYSGMPDLFFAWALARDKSVHYEFLDNSVPYGEVPRTIAFGQNGSLVIVDIDKFCDIDRFRHVNVDATSAKEILTAPATGGATVFLKRCCDLLPRVDFVQKGSDRICATATKGQGLVTLQNPCPILQSLFTDVETADDLGIIDSDLRKDTIGS